MNSILQLSFDYYHSAPRYLPLKEEKISQSLSLLITSSFPVHIYMQWFDFFTPVNGGMRKWYFNISLIKCFL